MSFGSFMGRLAALVGVDTPTPAADVTMNEPLLGTTSIGSGRLGSLFFGHGFGKHHAQTGKWGIEDMLELRRALFWIAAVVVLLLIVTNPTEASFRSHLTELSFRRHLADIRSSDSSVPSCTEEEGSAITLPTSGPSTGEVTISSTGGTETPPIAPFRFANHVAISLRTPPLFYKTLFFLSIALTSPLAPPAYLSDPTPIGKKHAAPLPRERRVLYLGYLGHWVLLGQVPTKIEWVWRLFTDGSREKGRKKNVLLDRAGISDLRSIANKDESLVPKAIAGIPSVLSSVKSNRKLDTSSLTDASTLPLHSHPASIPVAPFIPESRRASIVNLVSSQPLNTASIEDAASSPLITGLKVDLAAAQAALSEVQTQLHAHDVSVSSAHLHLQTSLEEVRTRRKEDDAERQELKSRTKNLEDQKRQAESAKRDAEKKLKSIEVVRDGLEIKIQAALSEIQELKGLMEVSGRNLRTVQEQGAKFVIETRESIEAKKEELEEVEGDIGELDARNEELGRAIKEAEEKVESAIKAGEEARKIGPEEEMMMMAAAYEAAAQEGYNHQPAGVNHGFNDRRNGTTNAAGSGTAGGSGNGGDQWAHQAAQYMAEAGMPYIDHQNYTARPSHSTSFGQFAKAHKAVDERRPADLVGFEDFGPGARGARTTTPPAPASDSGSDIWGHDPGSPNGGISSSFSANLLPQGLFRSLEGDQTPLDAATEADDVSVLGGFQSQDWTGTGTQGHDDIGYGSGSDSSDEHSGHEADIEPDHAWRSPLPAPGILQSGQQADSRPFLPPVPSQTPSLAISNSSGTGSQSTSAVPGLPAPLPGVRRWYSGTNSSDNVNNIFGVSPSNDSLLLSGYEASPFAPTSSEKQQLALKWGALSKRWARNDPPVTTGSSNGAPSHPGTTRSISADMSGGGWISHRAQPEDKHHQQGNTLSPLGAGQGQGEKKPFRFFSLRRPTSSGSANDRSGTSPAKE